MKNFILLLVSSTFLSSCLRLDDQLYSNASLDAYNFDAYTGEKEIPELPSSYNIADSMVKVFSLISQSSSEGDATIYLEYVGDINRIATDTIILYCHGNTDHMDRYWNRVKLLAHTGNKHRYGVLTLDYRGYGMSSGKPTEKGMYADVNTALKWLQSKGLSNERLVIYGYSLGSASATEMAANNYEMKPSKLILESPFASSEVMVQDGSKMALPASYFTNAKIDNAEEIKKVTQPFMWIHGADDDFLSITTHGEVVYKNYKGTYKEAHRIGIAVHNNVPFIWGFEAYSNNIFKFISK
jgi:pimeloyl-ACP methyl ester carboxylesterase